MDTNLLSLVAFLHQSQHPNDARINQARHTDQNQSKALLLSYFHLITNFRQGTISSSTDTPPWDHHLLTLRHKGGSPTRE